MLGTNRSVDNLGRICIPKKMRKKLGINDGDQLDIVCDGHEIKITKKEISCVICNCKENLEKLGGKHICGKCIDLLKGSIFVRNAANQYIP